MVHSSYDTKVEAEGIEYRSGLSSRGVEQHLIEVLVAERVATDEHKCLGMAQRTPEAVLQNKKRNTIPQPCPALGSSATMLNPGL